MGSPNVSLRALSRARASAADIVRREKSFPEVVRLLREHDESVAAHVAHLLSEADEDLTSDAARATLRAAADATRHGFETYEAEEGRPVLAKREEDKDGDGTVDVTSVYEKGRLKSRQISDPNLVPL